MTHPNFPKPLPKLSKPLQTFPNASEAFPNFSKPFQTFPNLSKPFQTFGKPLLRLPLPHKSKPTRPFYLNKSARQMARGRQPKRKPPKKSAREPSSCSPSFSRGASPELPLRESLYELQRQAKMAQNAELLDALAIERVPARDVAPKRRCGPKLLCAHAVPSTRLAAAGLPRRPGRRGLRSRGRCVHESTRRKTTGAC